MVFSGQFEYPTVAKYKAGAWDLSDISGGGFASRASSLRAAAKRFEANRKTIRPGMPFREFRDMLGQMEDILRQMSSIRGRASLQHATDTQSDKATQMVTMADKACAEASNMVLFFPLWWQRSVDEKNARRLSSQAGELGEYLDHKRLLARHTLSEPEEKIINILDVTGISALTKIYDKITNAYRYGITIDRKRRLMSREEITAYVRDASARTRKAAYDAVLSRHAADKGVTGEIYRNVALNWLDECVGMRGHGSPIAARNAANNIDDATVNSLLKSCKKNARLFQKYFAQKAKMLKKDRLRRYDLYAPVAARKEKRYAYDRSVRLVLDALASFSPVLEGYARNVFEAGHLDSKVRPGKSSGAFCSSVLPEMVPYVMVNFTGRMRDIFTLAHELGHAVHNQASKDRSIFVHHPPLPLAETASTFSELLLHDSLTGRISDDQRRVTLSEQLDDLYATIMRQSFFTIFESKAHEMVGRGTTIDEISGAYAESLREQFQDSVCVSPNFSSEWLCIPHFYHAPFYCYSYAFGNLLALSLFERYKREGASFVPSYIKILAAGGARKPESLLSEHGLDISSPDFWQHGFDYIGKQLNELESLD